MLNNEKINQEYVYETDQGSVEIYFYDRIFNRVDFPFKGPYTRDQWKLLVEIEQKITEIEMRIDAEIPVTRSDKLVLKVDDRKSGNVTFHVSYQDEELRDRGQLFRGSNGLLAIGSRRCPFWNNLYKILCIRGSDKTHDNDQLTTTEADFALISEAIIEFGGRIEE